MTFLLFTFPVLSIRIPVSRIKVLCFVKLQLCTPLQSLGSDLEQSLQEVEITQSTSSEATWTNNLSIHCLCFKQSSVYQCSVDKEGNSGTNPSLKILSTDIGSAEDLEFFTNAEIQNNLKKVGMNHLRPRCGHLMDPQLTLLFVKKSRNQVGSQCIT